MTIILVVLGITVVLIKVIKGISVVIVIIKIGIVICDAFAKVLLAFLSHRKLLGVASHLKPRVTIMILTVSMMNHVGIVVPKAGGGRGTLIAGAAMRKA